MSIALEFGRIPAPPTPNPGRCARCNHAYTADGKAQEIHWSIRCQRWLCLWCHFEAPDAGEKQ